MSADVVPIAIAALATGAILMIFLGLAGDGGGALECLPPYRHDRHRKG